MVHHQTIFRARRNGSSGGQFIHNVPINVDGVVDLLVACAAPGRHGAVRRPAHALLESMAAERWWVTAGPHAGGRGEDWTRHVTIRVGHRPFHLRLDKRGHAFEITECAEGGESARRRSLPASPKPWQSAGEGVG